MAVRGLIRLDVLGWRHPPPKHDGHDRGNLSRSLHVPKPRAPSSLGAHFSFVGNVQAAVRGPRARLLGISALGPLAYVENENIKCARTHS